MMIMVITVEIFVISRIAMNVMITAMRMVIVKMTMILTVIVMIRI